MASSGETSINCERPVGLVAQAVCEIYGSKGAVTWNLERMNELQYYSAEDGEGEKGFRTILATDPSHPYMSHWWPPAHNIGYEHEFHHAVYDFLVGIDSGEGIKPDFYDG